MKKLAGIVTDVGLALTTNAFLLGQKVEIAEFAVGDGGGSTVRPDSTMTSLVHEVWRGKVTTVTINSTYKNRVEIRSVIPSDVGGFTIREMGAFDKNGRLIAITPTGVIEKTSITDGGVHDMSVGIDVSLEHTEAITLTVDPTVVLATRKDLENHNKDPHAHDNRFLPLEAYHRLITIPHHLDLYPVPSVLPMQYGAGMGGAGEGPAGGTVPRSVPVSFAWPSDNEVTLYVPRPVAQLGTNPALQRLSDTTYILTWPDNDVDSLLIQLQTDGQEREPRYKLIEIPHGLRCYPIAAVAQLKWGAGMGGAGETPAGGTPPKSIPVQWEWPSSGAIALYVPKAAAQLGTNPQLHKIDSRQYTVTWPDNGEDSLYIRLI